MKRAWAWALASMVTLACAGARAQSGSGTPSPDASGEVQGQGQMRVEVLDDEQARSHFRVGQLLYAEGRFADAGAEFQRAYALSNRPTLLYNAYVAYRDANDLEHAIVVLDAYLRSAPPSADAEVLTRRLAAMRATLESRMTEQSEIEAERARLEAERARLEAEASSERERREAAEREVARQRSPVPWVVGGAGLAVLAGAGISALIASGNISDAEAQCPDHVCPRSVDVDEVRASVRRPAIATDVMLAAGGATLVTGVVLLLVRNSDRDDDEPPVAIGCGRSGCSGAYTLRF